MLTALPSRIMNYRVSAASPTDELITLGQILSEVGDYMSTILDNEHLSVARRCSTRLKKVISELISRKRIQSVDNLFEMPQSVSGLSDLKTLTVKELHDLYRQWPIRHRERQQQGREHLTFWQEGRIVRELQTRKAADKGEQLMIDYCTLTYANELDNLSFILSLPVHADTPTDNPQQTTGNGKRKTDNATHYTQAELKALIKKYSSPRSVLDRELLIEYTDLLADLSVTN